MLSPARVKLRFRFGRKARAARGRNRYVADLAVAMRGVPATAFRVAARGA